MSYEDWDAADVEPRDSSELICECGAEMDWQECEECGGDGLVGHDCGEDTCPCADPEPNVPCPLCSGEGGYLACFGCESKARA
jgi:hypothetical protein